VSEDPKDEERRPPDEVRAMAEEREAARRVGDFATADALRRRIREAGFLVADTPGGPVLAAVTEEPGAPAPPAPVRVRRSEDVENLLDQPPAFEVSIQWVVQGWPEDVLRGIDSFRRHHPGRNVQHVVVEAAPIGLDDVSWPEAIDLVRIEPEAGWAAARNAGLRRSGGAIVVVADGSIVATGDVLSPLEESLADAGVGVTGPFGVTTENLHHFHDSPGPEVDAVEAYLMAFRRELVEAGLRFDEKFRFYRTADVELSFQIKARGLRATVTPVPVERHLHRMWASTPEDRREKLSKRNFYRFLDRWRGRTDLTVGGGPASRR
jgi:hypothetical protein